MPEPKPHMSTEPKPRSEALVLLKVLKLGDGQIEAGQFQPTAEVFARLRKRYHIPPP